MSACSPSERVLHRETSAFQTLVVTERGSRRCLRFGEGPRALNQTCIRTDSEDSVDLGYARKVVELSRGTSGRVLIIGLGGGAIPTAIHRQNPQATIEAVELDPAVIRIAREWFGYTLPARAEDGAVTLARGETWDLIILDAFDDQGIPAGLFTKQLLINAKKSLAPNGRLLVNTFARAPTAARELELLEQTFDAVATHDVAHNRIMEAR